MACGLIEFGSLYLDGKPVYPGTSYKGGKIEIGPTIPNTTVSRAASKRLKWYFTGGRLMASACILRDISWDAPERPGPGVWPGDRRRGHAVPHPDAPRQPG